MIHYLKPQMHKISQEKQLHGLLQAICDLTEFFLFFFLVGAN